MDRGFRALSALSAPAPLLQEGQKNIDIKVRRTFLVYREKEARKEKVKMSMVFVYLVPVVRVKSTLPA
jgi:hypothetical protein